MCRTKRLARMSRAASIDQTAASSQYFLPRFAFLKLSPELLHIHTMLGRFARAKEDHWNIPAVAFLENGIVFDTDFAQRCAEFAQERRDGHFSFFAKMAARPRVESHLARARSGQARVLRMLLHGFGLEYF
jgi:hypothetical protein